MATFNQPSVTTMTNVLPDTGHVTTHDKKKCTSASCCSPSRLWKSIQQFLSQQDKEGLMKLCHDNEKQVHVLRVLLTSRYHNDPSKYGASNKHLVLNLADRMIGASIDNTALNLSNSIKRRKLVYEKFGKPLTDLNALQLAILYRHEDIVLSLLHFMKDHASPKEFNSFLHHQCGKQISSLHLAGFLGLPKVVEALLSFGMNPQLKNGRMKTPLECTDHLDCRQLLELALLPPSPPSLPELEVVNDILISDTELDDLPTTPTEMNLIDLNVNDHDIMMTDTSLVMTLVNEKEKSHFFSPINLETYDLTDTWMMDTFEKNDQIWMNQPFTLNLHFTDTWMMYMSSKNQSIEVVDLDLTDTWLMHSFMKDHQPLKTSSGFDWLTTLALNNTWLMNTLNHDENHLSMNVNKKLPNVNECNLNGTWLMHLKEDGNQSIDSSPDLNGTWFIHMKEEDGLISSLHLNGTWLMHLKEENHVGSKSLPHLDDTWFMDIWKENDHDIIDSKQDEQQSVSHLSFMHLMKHDDVLATPPLSPVQDDDDYDDDNESMNLDELPELELNDSSSPTVLHDEHGDTHLIPLLFNSKDLSLKDHGDTPSQLMIHSSSHLKLNDQFHSQLNHPLSNLPLSPPPPISSSLNDHDVSERISLSSSTLKDTSTSSYQDSSTLKDTSISSYQDSSTLIPQFPNEPPNQSLKQDHRTVHFDPKVILMETCIRGDLNELMETLNDLSHEEISSWLLTHRGDAGVHHRTLLQLALLNGHESIIHYLVNHVNVNVNQVDANGWTALHYATALGKWKMAEYLASLHLTDLFAQTDDGYLYEDCTRSRLDRIRCQWILDRAMMNHSLNTTHHPPHFNLTTSAPPLMCG